MIRFHGSEFRRPTQWSVSGQDWVVIANPMPPCRLEGFPGESRFADVVVRAHGTGTDATGALVVISSRNDGAIVYLSEYRIVAIERSGDRLIIRGQIERLIIWDKFVQPPEGDIAILVIDGPSIDDYDGLVQEADQLLAPLADFQE